MSSTSLALDTHGAIALGVSALALIAVTITACTRADGRTGAAVSARSGALITDLPGIDTQAPAHTETATFALG
jgi:hypothetical protein